MAVEHHIEGQPARQPSVRTSAMPTEPRCSDTCPRVRVRVRAPGATDNRSGGRAGRGLALHWDVGGKGLPVATGLSRADQIGSVGDVCGGGRGGEGLPSRSHDGAAIALVQLEAIPPSPMLLLMSPAPVPPAERSPSMTHPLRRSHSPLTLACHRCRGPDHSAHRRTGWWRPISPRAAISST